MSEAQFWVKYFQSRYFWRDKGAAVGDARKRGQELVADDLFARFEEAGDDTAGNPDAVRRAVDLSRTDADRPLRPPPDDPDLAAADEHPDDAAAPSAARVLRKFNRHAALVLGDDAPPPPPRDETSDVSERPPLALDLRHKAAAPAAEVAGKKRALAAARAVIDRSVRTRITLRGC